MARIELGDGYWVQLKDEVTMGDMESLARGGRRYDPVSQQWDSLPATAMSEGIAILVEEWSVPNGAPVTTAGFRSLPAVMGIRVQRAISTHLEAQGITPEDLADASDA